MAKKGVFFVVVNISKLKGILSGKLGCVFYFSNKKKTHPNSPVKIQKGAFFLLIKKKNALKYKLVNTGFFFRDKLYFQNQ